MLPKNAKFLVNNKMNMPCSHSSERRRPERVINMRRKLYQSQSRIARVKRWWAKTNSRGQRLLWRPCQNFDQLFQLYASLNVPIACLLCKSFRFLGWYSNSGQLFWSEWRRCGPCSSFGIWIRKTLSETSGPSRLLQSNRPRSLAYGVRPSPRRPWSRRQSWMDVR